MVNPSASLKNPMGYTLGMELLLHDQTRLSLDRPRLMGILNITPDSFSDGGIHTDVEQAVKHGLAMAEQGADIINVGGESTRPGAQRISPSEQIHRVAPVIRMLRSALDASFPHVPISIDTTLSKVAEAAVEAGAGMINDVSAATEDPQMLRFAADQGLPIVLMHMQGKPGTMQAHPTYADVVTEVREYLLDRTQAALAAGVDRRRIVLDPGIGFGKTTEHNLTLLRSIDVLVNTDFPVLVGASRKRFIGEFGGGAADQRLPGTCAVSIHCMLRGVNLLRVHDVAENRQALALIQALSAENTCEC